MTDAEITVCHGVRVAVAERAVVDEIRRVGELRAGVRTADMAFAGPLTSISRMHAYLAMHRQRRSPLVHRVIELADENVRSPREVDFRMIWVIDAGWPNPPCNRRVLDAEGHLLGIPDLLDIEHGIAGEFAGADHRGKTRHRKDVAREAAFRGVGLEYVEVVGADPDDSALVVKRMEEAKARSRLVPWTWRLGAEEESLDDRLAHLEWLRAQPDQLP